MSGALGCIIPEAKPHVAEKPLSALGGQGPEDVPVVVGFNWYDSFDPQSLKEMRSSAEGVSYHLPDVEKGEALGSIRGGHCFAFEPMGQVKLNQRRLQIFYNQKAEGACVGFGNCRAIAMQRGHQTFDGFWLYDESRKVEGRYPNGEGSTVASAAQVLEHKGLRVQTGQLECQREVGDAPVDPKLGVVKVRWAVNIHEVLVALARPNAQALPFQNNWGDLYPDVVWMPTATFARLLEVEGGECAIYTDR